MIAPNTTRQIPTTNVRKWTSIIWKPEDDSSKQLWAFSAVDFVLDFASHPIVKTCCNKR